MTSLASPRSNMSKSQLLTNNIRNERVLEAVESVKREDFVPSVFVGTAYVDGEIPLASGRFLMEPLVFCRLLELAEIAPSDTVLDIGCSTGYSSAVLSRLAKKLVALEEHQGLASEAHKHLANNKHNNIECVTSSLVGGVAGRLFDVIIIEGAAQVIPAALLDQLAEGGRLVTVECGDLRSGERSGLGRLVKITRQGGHLRREEGMDASVSLLPGFEKRQKFEL